jgi:predicted MPP superfamily phosphohydrolase
MSDLDLPLALFAIPGHMSWLLWLGNNVHAKHWPRKLIKAISFVIDSAIAVGCLAAVAWTSARLLEVTPWNVAIPPAMRYYAIACALNTVVGFGPWLVRRIRHRDPAALLSTHTVVHDLGAHLTPPTTHDAKGRIFAALPCNEIFQVALETKRLALPRLPVKLVGLKIAHLTDVHLTGILDRRFYERAFDLVNETDPDLTLITGDLLEAEECWDWIPSTFGRLRAKHGVYFIFGNHDLRVDWEQTRRRLIDVGLSDVGLRRAHVPIRGVDVVVSGTAMPWFAPHVPMDDCLPRNSLTDYERQFRILLSHSPDQFPWAKRHDFDLMVAGHVHGGQIRIPPLGPILAPSAFGTRYASGTFHEGPTVLHVSRGLSSKLPLRFFCKPEATVLVLEQSGKLAGTR